MSHSENCIFCKIVAGQIPSKKVYEDEELYAFHDIHPSAPVHFLIIPKRHFSNLMTATSADEALLGRMMTIAPRLALEQGCRPGESGGFRVMINNGADGGQEVFHYFTINGLKANITNAWPLVWDPTIGISSPVTSASTSALATLPLYCGLLALAAWM